MVQQFTLGPLTVHLYGLILGAAIATAWWWSERKARTAGLTDAYFEHGALGALIGGIIGARLYHVIDLWWYYREHVLQIPALWQGGLGIWGGVIGGVIGFLVVAPKERTSMIRFIDSAALALPLAQAIGRWGNYVNFELFGKPTSLPWGIFIPVEYRPAAFQAYSHFHPLFLYESFLDLGLFVILQQLLKRGFTIGSGRIFGAYLLGYGFIRLFMEPFRIASWQLGGIPTAQLVSLAAIAVGVVLVGRVGWGYAKKQ